MKNKYLLFLTLTMLFLLSPVSKADCELSDSMIACKKVSLVHQQKNIRNEVFNKSEYCRLSFENLNTKEKFTIILKECLKELNNPYIHVRTSCTDMRPFTIFHKYERLDEVDFINKDECLNINKNHGNTASKKMIDILNQENNISEVNHNFEIEEIETYDFGWLKKIVLIFIFFPFGLQIFASFYSLIIVAGLFLKLFGY